MNMKVITVKEHKTKEELDEIKGTYLDESYIKYPIPKDDTTFKNEKGDIVAVYLNKIVPFELCKKAFPFLRKASLRESNNRGMASGQTDEMKVGMKINGMYVGKVLSGGRFIPLKKDGTLSNSPKAIAVNSSVIGYMDRYARIPYCRMTEFSQRFFDEYKQTLPYIRYISKLYETFVPEKYNLQKAYWEKIHKDFKIDNTAFTTVTLNNNFRTACHTDKGDFKDGIGNLAVLEKGRYDGAYTVIPKYGIGLNVRNTDVGFFDVHEIHGNTEIVKHGDCERISAVCYVREKMIKCGSAKEELNIALERDK